MNPKLTKKISIYIFSILFNIISFLIFIFFIFDLNNKYELQLEETSDFKEKYNNMYEKTKKQIKINKINIEKYKQEHKKIINNIKSKKQEIENLVIKSIKVENIIKNWNELNITKPFIYNVFFNNKDNYFEIKFKSNNSNYDFLIYNIIEKSNYKIDKAYNTNGFYIIRIK